MIYVISDLHGCYEKYQKLLKMLRFGAGDVLYVLGDVIDRGDGGIRILLDMMQRPGVHPLLGNHESLALGPLLRIARDPAAPPTELHRFWLQNGGGPTEAAFRALSRDMQQTLLAYLASFALRRTVTAGGRRFHLSHTLPGYVPGRAVEDFSATELLCGTPDYTADYANGVFFVTGHTPTGLIDEAYRGRIYQTRSHIAIDCGTVFGYPLGCVCLDTLEKIYVPHRTRKLPIFHAVHR